MLLIIKLAQSYLDLIINILLCSSTGVSTA
uniref:Uncharacterized protein n=1 Tax=Anguilla anguilla TaxID=7936 RepID=A0A0E9UZ58_ANGAN